jgi:ParB family chromosome partitioning protein
LIVPPRTSTLQFTRGGIRAHEVVSLTSKREVRAEAGRALHALKVSWLPLEQLDEARDGFNSRKVYDELGINELAASIQEHGLLQPILVVPDGERYRVVCGERRRRAAIRAGVEQIPCVVKEHADDRTIFLWNIVENLQRVDLTPREKVSAIRQLGDSGLGVREISRGTGISPGTISKWLRIADKPDVVRALEEDRIDIARAMALAPIRDRGRLQELVARASELPQAEFYALAKRATRAVSLGNTGSAPDDARLADIKRKLLLVEQISPVGKTMLMEIDQLIHQFLGQLDTDLLPASTLGDGAGGIVQQNEAGHPV